MADFHDPADSGDEHMVHIAIMGYVEDMDSNEGAGEVRRVEKELEEGDTKTMSSDILFRYQGKRDTYI